MSVDRQPRAGSQDQRLQSDADKTGGGADAAGAVAGQSLQAEHRVVMLQPALTDGVQHAHGGDDLDVAQGIGREGRGARPRRVGFGQRLLGQALGEQSHGQEQDRSGQRNGAEQGMEQENHRQEDDRPGRVEEGEQAGPGEELAHLCQVMERLQRVSRIPAQCVLKCRLEDAVIERLIEAQAQAHQQMGACPFQDRGDDVEKQHHDAERNQRGLVAAAQHALGELEHVQRGRELEQVEKEAEQHDRIDALAQRPQRLIQLVAGRVEFNRTAYQTLKSWASRLKPVPVSTMCISANGSPFTSIWMIVLAPTSNQVM